MHHSSPPLKLQYNCYPLESQSLLCIHVIVDNFNYQVLNWIKWLESVFGSDSSYITCLKNIASFSAELYFEKATVLAKGWALNNLLNMSHINRMYYVLSVWNSPTLQLFSSIKLHSSWASGGRWVSGVFHNCLNMADMILLVKCGLHFDGSIQDERLMSAYLSRTITPSGTSHPSYHFIDDTQSFIHPSKGRQWRLQQTIIPSHCRFTKTI